MGLSFLVSVGTRYYASGYLAPSATPGDLLVYNAADMLASRISSGFMGSSKITAIILSRLAGVATGMAALRYFSQKQMQPASAVSINLAALASLLFIDRVYSFVLFEEPEPSTLW